MKCKVIAALMLMVSAAVALADIPKPGDVAPPFTGTDQNGKTVSLADFAGKRNVLLYFYPKDFTGGCTKEACGFRDRMADLQTNNVEVVGVSFDTAETHVRFAETNRLNFSLLPDPDGTIIAAYGVKMTGRKMAKRVSFLIGTDGRIIHVTEAASAQTHFEEMKTAIAGLRAAEAKRD
jgi:peroxiredoxin Q/BCP